jgi:hypothetical protein
MSYRFGIIRTAQKTVGAVKIYFTNEKKNKTLLQVVSIYFFFFFFLLCVKIFIYFTISPGVFLNTVDGVTDMDCCWNTVV